MNPSIQLLASFMGLGGMELVIILAIVMLLFGATKLPALAKGLGQSVKEFKKASQEDAEPEAPPAKTKPKTTQPQDAH